MTKEELIITLNKEIKCSEMHSLNCLDIYCSDCSYHHDYSVIELLKDSLKYLKEN